MEDRTQQLRSHLATLLTSGHAHAIFEEIVEEFPPELRGRRVPGVEHTAWHLLEHLRIAQRDILEFSRGPHESPAWPDDYWPTSDGPESQGDWDQSVERYLADRQAMIDLISDPSSDLFVPFPWGDGQTLLREALLVADHNAYHLGQLTMLRHVLG